MGWTQAWISFLKILSRTQNRNIDQQLLGPLWASLNLGVQLQAFSPDLEIFKSVQPGKKNFKAASAWMTSRDDLQSTASYFPLLTSRDAIASIFTSKMFFLSFFQE